jgi:hypothetical protein
MTVLVKLIIPDVDHARLKQAAQLSKTSVERFVLDAALAKLGNMPMARPDEMPEALLRRLTRNKRQMA